MRAIRRRKPIRCALHAREDPASLRGWVLCRNSHGLAAIVETRSPSHFGEGLSLQVLTRGAVQHVIETISVGPQHHRRMRAFPFHVGQHGYLHRIIVVVIVWRELEIPLQLARIRIQRDNGIAIEIGRLRVRRCSNPDPDSQCPSKSGSIADHRNRSPKRNRRRVATNHPPRFRDRARPAREWY